MDTIAMGINMLRNDYDVPNSPWVFGFLVMFMSFCGGVFIYNIFTTLIVLLYRILTARMAVSGISDRMTRLEEWLTVIFEDDSTEAEKWVVSYVVTAGFGFLTGVMYALFEWTRKPVVCMFAGFMTFCLTPRSWRVRVYEAFNSCVAWFMTELDRELGVSDDETLTQKDAINEENMENKDEESTGADDVIDTDDNWSSGLNTPSETESSHSSGPSTSRNNVHTVGAELIKASVREATRAGFRPELAASYLDDSILPPAVKDPQKKFSSLQDIVDYSPPTTEPIRASEQIPYGENVTTYSVMLRNR
jgi:hypothetical protein